MIRRHYEAILLSGSRGVHLLLDRLFRAVGRLIPEDIFVSYARVDGSRYAMGLAAELASRDRHCITDVYAAEAGAEMPPGLFRALRRSRQLVVLGTPGAVGSQGVALEVQHFPRDGRSLVVIGFCDSVRDAPWFPPGFDPQEESNDRLVSGEPSPEIVTTILQAHRFKTQQQRLAVFAVGVLVLVTGTVVIGATIAAYYTSMANAADERRRTVENELSAAASLLEARQRELAETTRALEATSVDLHLAEARKTILDATARRRETGYTPVGDVVGVLTASRELMVRGLPHEAEAALRDSAELIPAFKGRFRVDPKGPSTLAGEPPRFFAASGTIVEVWNPFSGTKIGALEHEGAVRALQAAGGDKWLLVTTADEVVTVWDLATSTIRRKERCQSRAGPSTVSSEDQFAIVCDGVIRVGSLGGNSSAPLSWRITLDPAAPMPIALRFIDASTGVLLSVSSDRNGQSHALAAFRVSATAEPQQIPVDVKCVGGRLRWAQLSNDGGAVLSTNGQVLGGGNARACTNIAAVAGPSLSFGMLELAGTSDVHMTDISRRGNRIVTIGDGTARIWTNTGDVIRELTATDAWEGITITRPLFSRDGRYVLLPRREKQLWLIDSVSAETVAVIPRPDRVSDLDVHGRLVVLITNGEVQVWETQGFGTPGFSPGIISPDTLTPADSTAELIGSQSYAEGRAHWLTSWRLPTGELTLRCDQVGGFNCRPDVVPMASSVIDLAYQPGAGWMALDREGGEYRAWRLAPRAQLHRWAADAEYVLAAEGTLAVSAEGRVRVIDVRERRELQPIDTDRARIVQFLRSPTGPLLARRASDCTLQLVGLERGDVRASIDECAVRVAISGDGRFVVVGANRRVGVWDLKSARWLARRDFAANVRAVGMSGNQEYVAVSTRVRLNDRITLWRWRWDDVRERVCATLRQNLRAAQWAALLQEQDLAAACATPAAVPASSGAGPQR